MRTTTINTNSMITVHAQDPQIIGIFHHDYPAVKSRTHNSDSFSFRVSVTIDMINRKESQLRFPATSADTAVMIHNGFFKFPIMPFNGISV